MLETQCVLKPIGTKWHFRYCPVLHFTVLQLCEFCWVQKHLKTNVVANPTAKKLTVISTSQKAATIPQLSSLVLDEPKQTSWNCPIQLHAGIMYRFPADEGREIGLMKSIPR